jgi:hypothetical protein
LPCCMTGCCCICPPLPARKKTSRRLPARECSGFQAGGDAGSNITNRLVKNTHLLRCAHHSSLRRTVTYDSFLLISRALHLDVFDRPGKNGLFYKRYVTSGRGAPWLSCPAIMAAAPRRPSCQGEINRGLPLRQGGGNPPLLPGDKQRQRAAGFYHETIKRKNR